MRRHRCRQGIRCEGVGRAAVFRVPHPHAFGKTDHTGCDRVTDDDIHNHFAAGIENSNGLTIANSTCVGVRGMHCGDGLLLTR